MRYWRSLDGEGSPTKTHTRRHTTRGGMSDLVDGGQARRPGAKPDGEGQVTGGPLDSPAVTHYIDPSCNVTFVPTEYSRNVAIGGHY